MSGGGRATSPSACPEREPGIWQAGYGIYPDMKHPAPDEVDLLHLDGTVWIAERKVGLPVYDFPFDTFLPCSRSTWGIDSLTAVSRVGAVEDYQAFCDEMREHGVELIHSPAQHDLCSELPLWYPLLASGGKANSLARDPTLPNSPSTTGMRPNVKPDWRPREKPHDGSLFHSSSLMWPRPAPVSGSSSKSMMPRKAVILESVR